jgi:hypothetical protein
MKITTLLASLLIIVAGPAVTVCLFTTVNVSAGVFPLIVGVLTMSGVTAGVSTAAHRMLKDPVPATAISVAISEMFCVLLLLAYIFCLCEGRERAESIMWLPVMIPFLLVFGFPTAFSVSYGTGMIVMNFRGDTSDCPHALSRRLIEDEKKQVSEK